MDKNFGKFIITICNSIKKNSIDVYHFDEYDVYIDKNGNRFIEAKDDSFHLLFLKKDGFTAKWGRTIEDDPTHCAFGNEIADIEITKACRGIRNIAGKRIVCPWCYKSNTPNGNYMNFETFKNIFDKLNVPKTMTQIAFGVDAEASDELNPDIWKIMDYCIENNVTPNITVADIDERTAKNLVKRCGAIAVSYYANINKDCCYNTVKLLIDEAKKINKQMKINIHCLISKETYDSVFDLINDCQNDERLKDMGSIVFLSLKQKGRGEHFNQLTTDEFKKIIDTCFDKKVSMGFDSCSAPKFLNAIKGRKDEEFLKNYVESCESVMYSMYIDANGIFYPCSFMEKEGEWEKGIDMKNIDNFISDVWYEDRVVDWRNTSIQCINCNGCNKCKFYDV